MSPLPNDDWWPQVQKLKRIKYLNKQPREGLKKCWSCIETLWVEGVNVQKYTSMSLQICSHLCSLWFLLSWRIILSCRVIWSYCLMCIISNADQSLRKRANQLEHCGLFFFCSFLNRSILGSVFNLIDVFNLIGSARTSRLVAAVRLFTSVCFCVSSVRKYEFYLWIQCFGLKATVCNNLLFVFNRPIQFVSVQFKGQKLNGQKSIWRSIFISSDCAPVLLRCLIKCHD